MEQKYLIGTVAVLALIVGGSLGIVLSPEKDYFQCESKDLISDCVNGVKADGLRCYHDPENTRAYTYCPEGWKAYEQVLSSPQNAVRNSAYVCTVEGCET